MQNAEFAYLGQYFCWKAHNQPIIHFANVTELQNLASMKSDLSLGDASNTSDVESRRIDLSDFIKPG